MKWEGSLLQKREISRFWVRRLFESALFVSCLVIVLYIWARFIPTGYRLPIGEAIGDIPAAISAAVSLVSAIICLWLPHKYLYSLSIFAYFLIVSVIVSLISTTGYLTSPFITAWLPVAVFAGIFGPAVPLVMALVVISTAIFSSISHGATIISVMSALFFGLAPVALSMIIWHRQPSNSKAEEFSKLKNKLSSVEGKSDIVINTIDDGVLAISKEGNIELINPSAQNIIGWNKGDALGLKWQSVIQLVAADGKEVSETDNPIHQALTGNKPTHSDKLMLRTSSDKQVLVSIVSSPVGSDGDGIIVVFRDITKEKAEEREQAEFISTASHEMRTPVASIEGYLGLALNPATAHIDEKARDFITKAHESAQHLGRLFQDLLDISRAEDGRLKNEPRLIDVNEFIGDIFDGLAAKASEKNLNYIYQPRASGSGESVKKLMPVFYVNVDADHLREVVSNLIENAIKYTPSGDVIVDVAGDDSMVTISVKDSGIGIPTEDLSHLFQKFYRVDNSETREIGGTGLGLYLSRRLAENMNGRIKVESEFKKGSTFSLEIPRASKESALQNQPTQLTEQKPDPEPTTAVNYSPIPQESSVPEELKAADQSQATNINSTDTTPEQPTKIPVIDTSEQAQSGPININGLSLAEIENQVTNRQARQSQTPEDQDRARQINIPPR